MAKRNVGGCVRVIYMSWIYTYGKVNLNVLTAGDVGHQDMDVYAMLSYLVMITVRIYIQIPLFVYRSYERALWPLW